MAERPLYTLYKNLKAQNYDVPDDYNKFESALTRDGKGGADNRHAIYENLKAQNFDVPNTYERFYSALFEPRSKTSSRAKGGSVPMSAADRARFSAGAAAISASAQHTMNNAGRYNRLKQRKQKQQKDFGRVNLGTHQTPYGDANNVVKDDFAYNPETGKAGAYVSSDNENVYSQPEAEQKQAVLDQQNNTYQEAVDTGDIPSVFDVRDKNGNYDLQENINKNGTYLTEEGARNQFDKKLADAYARKKEIEALIAEDHRQHGNPLLSYGASIGASNGRTAEQSDYSNKLATSLALVKQQIGALEAVKQYPTSSWDEDALKALDNTAFTAKTWDFGLTDFATMGQMERIKTKMDNNLPLSGSDKMLLKSKLGADAAAALEDEKMGNIYRWTKIAGQSLPFMADFFLTGGYGGITKGISRGALKYAAKRGMGKVSAAILKNTGIVAGDVIGSYAMAGSVQAMKTGADIMQRHLGSLYQDEKGDYKFGTFDENGNLLHEGGESMGTALYKGLTSAMVENYTEKLFGHSYGIKKGAINFMEKHGMNASAEFFKNIGKSGWYTNSKKWMEKFGINGFGEEVMEEEIGIPLHALLDGDNKFSDLLDTKQQLDIIGGMALSVGSMYAMGAGSRPVKGVYNRAQYYRFRNKVNVADSDAQNLMGDKWADIKDKIDNTTNEQMGGVLADILRQRDTMSKDQINAAINYGINLMKMRGYNVAKTAEMNAREITNEPTTPEEQHQEDIDNAYSEGHDADDADKHDIQLEHEDQMKTLAGLLNISEQQLSAMNDDELQSLTGQNDKLDQAIYDYQLSSARYQGVTDDAQDKIDMAANQAAQRVDMYTDKSRDSVRNATVKASSGAEDYGVYIISGNIATNEDGSINVADSDDMILFYDPTTNSVEHADALRFAELGDEVPADDVKAQAVADAKEKAIKEVAGIVDGTIDVGSQFKVTGADGLEHTYEILADYGDGTAAISIDGNVVENPYSLEDLQQLKDLEDQKRLEAAKAQREQMEKERAEQTQETQPSFDFNQILNDNGNVVLADVLGKDGNTKYPNSQLFLIRDSGAKANVVELKSDGTLFPHEVNKKDVRTATTMTLDEYKQAFAESSMIEENSGAIEVEDNEEGKLLNRNDDGAQTEQNQPSASVTTSQEDAAGSSESKDTNISANGNKNNESLTFEDGTPIPVDVNGEVDLSQTDATHAAEWYDNNLGEDADDWLDGEIKKAKKVLEQAKNKKLAGTKPSELVASKKEKEAAIADAQAHYDSAISIRDSLKERRIAKEENTAEGRRNLIEKARRKFARLKSAVKDDAEAVSQLYKDVVGSLLHRLYDSTGIDVTDTIPLTAEEYVASNLGAHSLNYEGTETSKGVKQETGLSREDFAKTQLLAADGKGTTIDDLVHSLWENRPSNLESLNTQDIRNALIGVLTSGFKASEARNYVENLRIAQAENFLEEQKKAADNAAFAEQQTTPAEQQTETAPESEEKTEEENSDEINDEENEKINEQTNENINAPEVPEDATDENPLGAQLDQTDLPFSARDNGTQQTTAERAADVEKNKVDDMKVVDNIVGQKTRKAFERLAKMMGADIQWQYSDKLGNGWIQENTDADGNVHRTIYITLDSSITEGAQFIFGHEMTHQIKNLNPAAYNELTQLVLDTYGADAYDKAVDETMQRYSDAGFSGRARDYYAEEVVADAVGEMIRDLNLAHTLAMKMSHPLLAAIHEILQKIKLAFYGTEYSDVTKNIIRSIEQAYVKTANGEITNSETGEDVSYSLRQKPEPKKKGIGYKVFVLKDGKLYPPMVANPDGAATPVGVWLDADAAPIAGESKTGRPQVKQGGKGTQGGSGKLAYRPGWHLGVVPYAIQFNRKDAEGNKTLFPKNFVFAEVEYAADVDYQEEARQEGINPSGKYQHSLAGLKHLPTDGYYMYRTNPNPETDPWVITGAMKVNRILTRAEQAELVKNAGREPQQIQEGDIVTDDVVNSINQEIAAAPKFSLKVYHGSGADFTEFDFDHMGEGAGSQAFGWGGYVTSSKKIGKSYATMMDNDPSKAYYRFQRSNGTRFAKKYPTLESFLHGDKQIAMNDKFTEQEKIDFYNEMKKLAEPYHNLYEVDIPEDNGGNYLDWDAPITDELIDKVAKALPSLRSYDIKDLKKDRTFDNFYKTISMRSVTDDATFNDDKAASKLLSSLGYTGIKYKAGRNFGGAEVGDTNYVIFKPEDMRITEHTKFSLKSKPVRFEAGKKLSDEEKKEVLSTLKDAYKENGVPYHIEETAGGKEKRVYEPTADSYVVSDITNRPLRYYITLPDGRVAHPTEVYPNISDNEVKSSATKQGLLDDEVDQIVRTAIGNMKDIADNAKAVEVLTELQNLPHETHDVGYGLNHARSYNYKTGIFTSDAAQAIDYVVRRMRRKEDVPAEIPAALKKAVTDSYGMVDNLIDGMSNTKVGAAEIKPVSVGVFGNVYNQFRGKAKAAIEFLKKLGSGEATAALHHHTIGDISLVWGDKKTGLDKILRKHPEVVDNLQSIIDSMEVVQESNNRIKLESPTHFAVVSKEYKGEPREQWLLTAYEKRESLENGKSMDTATSSLGGDTALSQSKESAAKIDNSSETTKENGEKVDSKGTKFSLKDEEYLKAVEDGNMEKAQKMVNEAAEAAGYSTDSSYQGTSAFNGAAPWGNGYFLTKDERKEAWDNGEFEGESTLGDYINDDIDGGNLEELTNAASYRTADPMRKEAIDNVRNAIQKKSKTITMYRSVPSDVKEGSFRNGDWVTPSRAYAVDNAKLHGWGDDYNIIEQKVSVDDVWFDGNDIAEWGYGREEDYVNDTDFAYKNTKNNRKLLDAVTYDDNGEVIPLSQRFNEKNNDVRFSLKDEKTMFGMHNISIDKLRKAIKQGGFAAPSMGVVDSKNGIYSDYGEITLIPKAEKLAKRTGKNAGTFTADAWTPTYPQVERIMNKQGEKAFNTDMNEKLGDVDNGIYSNIRESWKGYLSSGDVRDGLYWHYLFDKGMNPETIYQTGKYDNDITNEVMRISDNGYKTDYTDEEVAELIQLMNKATGKDNDVDAQREKLKARIASAEKQGNHLLIALKKKRLAELEGIENFFIAADFVNDVVRNNRKNGKVDVHDTMGAAKEKVENDKKLSADFPSWLDKKTEEYGVEEMLYNGTTPSGKPKYIPNTIDNAVKLMKKQGVAGGYTAFGSELGVFIAKNSPEVNTLAAMKNAKDKLIPFGDERHNQIKDKITKEFLELSDEIRVGSNNRYAFDDSGVSRMVELTDHKGNEKEYLKKAYNVEVSDEWIDRYNKLLDTIKKDYNVFYFETKFMRPYGLDEFEKAIVPNDTPSDVVDALKKAGIDVSSYERGNAEDRQKVTMDAINSSDNIRFSLKAEKEKIVADAKANGTYMIAPNGEKTKLDAEQWATVRTANFKNWFGDWENDPENASKVVDENGEPMVVWHGRSAEFNTFEKKEGVRFIMGLEDKVKAEGFFFSPDKGLAEEFASNSSRHRGGKANVVPCFLNIRKPMDLTGEDYDRIYEDVTGWEYMVGMDTQDNLWGIMDEEGMADKIKEKGYDGAIFVEEVDDSYEPTKISYCALDANQIKSAENNNGDFSADNNDIRFSLKSMMEKPEGWKQANKKAIHIAEAIERDPKFSLKNLDGTLIKAGTYFSGGGLVEEGLKGIIDPVVAVEYDEKISGVYRNNFGQHIVTADVRDVDPKELVKQIDGEVEYFHASPVCKNYSQAKSNHAEVELDKETAASTAEFINAVKPKVVTIENVKGYKDSDAMKTITDALDANGYTWDADVYNAADYGGYTNRERLIVRAVRDGKLPDKPKKMAHKNGWYEAVADIIPTLTEKKNGVAPWMDVRLKADGIDWRNIDKPLYVMGSAYADGKVPHAFADELLPTLRTKSGDVIVMPDGKVYRAMGRVLARVSGVSDDYKMPFSENLSHTIIGNGIPTQLTEHVIAPLLTGSDPKFSIRTYHGTGVSFDKFDLSHAFEGEGSETFGHGVYVTNSKKIGDNYAQRAKDRKGKFGFDYKIDMSAEAGQMLSHYINKNQDVDKGLENARQDLKSALEMFPDDETLKELSAILQKDNNEIAESSNEAYRYDVDIPDDNGENYLGWNESQNFPLEKWYRLWEITHHGFSDNEYFKDGGARYDKDRIERIIQMKLDSPENGMQNLPTLKGEELYHALEDFFDRERPLRGAKLASRALSEIGFVGIKYPAGMIHGGAEEADYNYVIFDENNANIVGNTKFSLRYDQFEHDLNQWKKDNNLPKDAQRPTIPQRNAGESAAAFLKRVDEYRKQMALWKTAPTYEQHLLSDDTALGEFNRELQKGSVLKRIAFQDSMLAIRKAQEAIMKEVGVDRLNMAEDAYTAENRSHGKGKNEFEEYNNEFLQPLRKAYHQMKKVLGDSYDNVRVYMMAKHGLERDAQMAFKKSLEADYEDVNQRSAAYKAYKNDLDRVSNDADLEFGRVDFTTWRQKDNALRGKYSPSYMDYRYDDNGIAYDYSGLSSLFDGSDFEEAAHKLVRDVETKHLAEVQALWNATNAATKKILRDGFKAGMMSKEAYEYVKGMYSNYIPLRGWDGTTADQVWDYIGGGKGAFNQTLKTAHGRTSIADDPIAYIENMAESGILLNNKNWVKQHLMLLAQNHPTSLLTLSKAWYVKSTDANGNEEWIPATPQITSQMNSNQVKAAIDAFEKKMEQMAQTGDATQQRDGLNIAYPQTHSEEREHEVRVMKDGEEYVIYVNGDPQLAQAMNNTRAHRVREIQSGKLDRAAAWLGRKMAAAYTSLSPLFIPSNYFRDLTMTLASTAIREDAKYNYLLRKNLATSWNLGFMLRDYQNGKLREKVSHGNATPKEQMFYDFMMNGGETGFVSSLDVEDLKKKFKNDLKDLDRWKANPVKVGHTIMDGIEFLNRAIEDSNRFAVYMTSIQYGRSIDEAVNDAKDVTLNFNRKGTGEYGWQMVRNLYLFINPAVQSLQTLGALAKHHPFKFTAVTASWLASGVLVPIVNAALMSLLGGDDDKDKYWQFTKWDRRNNLIMWVPFTHEYVKIPLAQEFRAFYGIGDMIASKMMGGELAEESWSQYGEDLLGQVVDMLPLDPTGYDGNIAVSLMPNAIRPVFELAFNVDFTGKPLFKDSEYNKYDPNFTKAYVGTPDWLVRASKMVNSIGNDYPDVQQNSIDAFGDPRYNLNNPAVVDHVLSSYLGGAYTMGSQVLGLLTKSLNDPKEIKVADIPLFSKFVSNPDDRPVTKKQGDEFWNMKENHDRAANTLSKLKKQAKVDGDYSMLERFYGSEEYKQYKQDDVKVKKYEEDKKKERAEESGEEYRPHKLNAEDIYKAHATPKDDFEDLKLKQLYTKLNGFKTSYDLLVDTAPSQSDGYYNINKAAIDAIDEISLDKQEISELKKGFLDDGKDAYNAEDMKRIRELRKNILAVLEKANKVVAANQKAKAEK